MKVVLIGSGGVATSITAALTGSAIELVAIYSRTLEHAEQLRDRFSLLCRVTDDLRTLPAADLYIVAVSDHAIPTVAAQLPPLAGMVVHTSAVTAKGALSAQRLYGVWYPFNSYSSARVVPFDGQKILYELSSPEALPIIEEWNALLHVDATPATIEQRRRLHLAGVFACNFTNRLYLLARQILRSVELPSSLIDDIIVETAHKATTLDPYEGQTGPARRHDFATIARHEQMLESLSPEMQQLYSLFTDSIIQDYPL